MANFEDPAGEAESRAPNGVLENYLRGKDCGVQF